MEYLMVDGYNIINAWRDIFKETNTLEHNREILLEMLSDYQGYTDFRITVVFDAYLVPEGKGSLVNYDNLRVIYTGNNQTADTFIERYVVENKFADRITVVTGDYLEQKAVFLKGALRMTAKELRSELSRHRKENAKPDNKTKNFIIDTLDSEQKRKLKRIREDDGLFK
ncbi:MAG: NYN domain-containing protein [Clostridia bacterium]|jgi:hypothetical protein